MIMDSGIALKMMGYGWGGWCCKRDSTCARMMPENFQMNLSGTSLNSHSSLISVRAECGEMVEDIVCLLLVPYSLILQLISWLKSDVCHDKYYSNLKYSL